jgi:hypothetical protein
MGTRKDMRSIDRSISASAVSMSSSPRFCAPYCDCDNVFWTGTLLLSSSCGVCVCYIDGIQKTTTTKRQIEHSNRNVSCVVELKPRPVSRCGVLSWCHCGVLSGYLLPWDDSIRIIISPKERLATSWTQTPENDGDEESMLHHVVYRHELICRRTTLVFLWMHVKTTKQEWYLYLSIYHHVSSIVYRTWAERDTVVVATATAIFL